MNHPSYKLLHDYFEAEIDSENIKQHLAQCPRCSVIVEQMVKVDVLVMRGSKMKLRDSVRDEIFINAKKLLKERRDLLNRKKEIKKIRIDKWSINISLMEVQIKSLWSDLKSPLLHSLALSVLLFVFTKLSITHKKVDHLKIFESDMTVVYSELRGDDFEDN